MEHVTSSEGAPRRRRNLPLPTANIPPAAEVLTRHQAAAFLCAQGYPVSVQLLHFYGMAANRADGPPVSGVWGRRIYTSQPTYWPGHALAQQRRFNPMHNNDKADQLGAGRLFWFLKHFAKRDEKVTECHEIA